MALSNIFREPRREITESVVGMIVVAALIFADYRFGMWLQNYLNAHSGLSPGCWNGFFIVGMIFGVFAIFAACQVLFIFPHWVGEVACDLLANLGADPRPKRRY